MSEHDELIARLRRWSAESIGREAADALERVTRERDSLRAFKRSVDEALNSGDGSYRP